MSRLFRKCSLFLCFCITFVMLLPSVPAQAEVKFADVDPRSDSWAYGSIYTMAQKGILSGYADGRFRPEQPISKAEWTVMVARLFDKYRPNTVATEALKIRGYVDVTNRHWAYKEIMDMYDYTFPLGTYGLTGQGEMAFRPDVAMTRLQLAQMLYGFFDNRLMDRRMSESDVCSVFSGFKDVPMQIYTDTDDYDDARKGDGRFAYNGSFSDDNGRVFATLFMSKGAGDCRFGMDEFSNIQALALASLHSSGIMTAKDLGYFRPLDKVTRAEAVTILERIYNYLNRNGWLKEYTTKDLNDPGAGGGAAGGLNGSGSGGTGGSSWNPYYPGGTSGTGMNPSYDQAPRTGVSSDFITVRDYFDDKGVIVKDIQRDGEIETAVEIGDNKYLTISLKSKEKVDLYVLLDNQLGYVKQEELPMTIPVEGMRQVGMKTQLRSPNPNKVGDFTATLSVTLLKEQPTKSTKPGSRK